MCNFQCALFLVCNVQGACRDLLLGSFVPSVLCNSCPVCAVCYVTGWPLIPRPDAVYTIITHMRSARVLHGICCKMFQSIGGEVFSASAMYQWHEHPKLCLRVLDIPFSLIFFSPVESVLKAEHILPRCNPDYPAGGQANSK